jgi:hypothetical protein
VERLFDIIGSVDVFVVYDDVQFRKNHWHNRNLIKTHQGIRWLSVPVSKPEGIQTPIRDIRLAGRFAEKHWRSIEQAYARAAAFERYGPALKSLFQARRSGSSRAIKSHVYQGHNENSVIQPSHS